jgi:uncharacterized protein with von Willebrand factor type A (vWA) domain
MVATMEHSDAVATLVRFARALRAVGLPVAVEQIESFARAFEWLDPLSLADVYHAARATLVTRHEDLPTFDAVFQSFWLAARSSRKGQPAPRAPRHDGAEPPALAVLLAERAQRTAPEVEVRDRSGAASATELLSNKDFSQLTPEELLLLRRRLLAERWRVVERPTRRRVAHRRGHELDWRRLTARAARNAGAVLALPRRRPKIKQRPLVVLADISGSMELYTRIVLYFLHALRQNLARVETFVFATRLTRITPELQGKNIELALSRVSLAVCDFQSGTRIGACLRSFNTVWSRRVLGRGAVVVIVSDGCDCGDVELLKQEMRFLRDRCHRLIWLNPRLGERRYEPRVAGMAAALPYVDDFLAAHNLQSLQELGEHLARLPRRRGSRSGALAAGYASRVPASRAPASGGRP